MREEMSSDSEDSYRKKIESSVGDSSSKELPPVKTQKKPSPPPKGKQTDPAEESYSQSFED
jgi:hypothetical protein